MAVMKNMRHEEFCIAYTNGENVGWAACRAGYSHEIAHEQGTMLLERRDIQIRINQLQFLQKQECEALPQKAIDEFASFAFANIGNVLSKNSKGKTCFDLLKATEQQLSGIDIKVRIGKPRFGRSPIIITATNSKKLPALNRLLKLNLPSENPIGIKKAEPITITFGGIIDAKDL